MQAQHNSDLTAQETLMRDAPLRRRLNTSLVFIMYLCIRSGDIRFLSGRLLRHISLPLPPIDV